MSLRKSLAEAEALTRGSFGDQPGEVDLGALNLVTEKLTQDLAQDLRFNPGKEPEKPRPVIRINESIISSTENITVISGASKVGKSRLFSALISGTFKYNELLNPDFMGFSITQSPGTAVVYIDTEQSRYDWYRISRSCYRRVNLDKPPAFFGSYNFRGLSYAKRIAVFEEVLKKEADDFGGIHLIALDGIADFCKSPNDEEESFEVVDWIESIAVKYRTPVVTTLHLNPGEQSEKMRGHLGSQIERKAESVFILKRDDKAQGVEIKPKVLRNSGGEVPAILIKWDRDKHDFVFSGEIKTQEARDYTTFKPEELRDRIDQVFLKDEELKGDELRLGIKIAFGYSNNSKIAEVKAWLKRINWIATNGEPATSPKLRYIKGPQYLDNGPGF